MITLSKTRTITLEFKDALVEVTFRIPTAADLEDLSGKKNSYIFEKMVDKVCSPDIEGWVSGVSARVVLDAPGVYSVVSETAKAVLESAFLEKDLKNA